LHAEQRENYWQNKRIESNDELKNFAELAQTGVCEGSRNVEMLRCRNASPMILSLCVMRMKFHCVKLKRQEEVKKNFFYVFR
jgi:hypothetical protein